MNHKVTFMFVILLMMANSHSYAQEGLCSTADDVINLAPRHWCEVPNSALLSAEKKPYEYDDWNGASSAKYDSYQRVMGVQGLTRAWNSAAFDTKRNCLMVAGGGHNDYGGNEVYRFCLGDLTWSRLTDPTVFPNRHPSFQNDDNTPVSRHTYGGLAYIKNVDRFFMFDGAPDDAAGVCGARGTWTLDLLARESAGTYLPSQWELRASENEPDRGCDNASTYDGQTGKVIFKSGSGTFEFDAATNIWSQSNNVGRRNSQVSLAVDSDRRLLVEVGGGVTALWSIDESFTGGQVQTTGATYIEGADDPGLVYDTRLRKIVGWSGGTAVYTLDTGSRIWEEIPPASTSVANPGPVTTSGGVFGRFNYSPELNVYMYVGRVDQNVMLYRLTDGEPLIAPRPPSNLISQ